MQPGRAGQAQRQRLDRSGEVVRRPGALPQQRDRDGRSPPALRRKVESDCARRGAASRWRRLASVRSGRRSSVASGMPVPADRVAQGGGEGVERAALHAGGGERGVAGHAAPGEGHRDALQRRAGVAGHVLAPAGGEAAIGRAERRQRRRVERAVQAPSEPSRGHDAPPSASTTAPGGTAPAGRTAARRPRPSRASGGACGSARPARPAAAARRAAAATPSSRAGTPGRCCR